MEFKGLKRQTSQASMSPYGAGLGACEIYDRQGSAARRLQRQESVPANKLVRIRLYTFLYNIICIYYCALPEPVKKKNEFHICATLRQNCLILQFIFTLQK